MPPMPKLSIDLERASLNYRNHVAPLPLPVFRRRKGLMLLLLAASITMLVVWKHNALPTASSSMQWVKDTMRANGSEGNGVDDRHSQQTSSVLGGKSAGESLSLASPSKVNIPSASASVAAAAAEPPAVQGQDLAAQSIGSPAFRKLAAAQGYTTEETDRLASLSGPKLLTGPPSAEEKTLLLLQALLNHHYHVPSSGWQDQLMPATSAEFASRLAEVQGQEGIDDVKLYKSDRTKWNLLHRDQHPLVVFSKSYCPYSKKAKALLKSLGARFTVYEVDLRSDDAGPLQQALAAISGHRTFPALFARGKLLGGSDDLERLNNLNVLKGVLSGAGAL